MRSDHGALWALAGAALLAGAAQVGAAGSAARTHSRPRGMRGRTLYALQELTRAYGPWWRKRRPPVSMQLSDSMNDSLTEVVRRRVQGDTAGDEGRDDTEAALDERWSEVVSDIGEAEAAALLREALDVYVDMGEDASLEFLFLEGRVLAR
jgi:hypothetical protein